MLITIFMMMLKLTVYNGDNVAMFMVKIQAQKSLTDSEALLTRTPTFSSFATTLLNLHLPAMWDYGGSFLKWIICFWTKAKSLYLYTGCAKVDPRSEASSTRDSCYSRCHTGKFFLSHRQVFFCHTGKFFLPHMLFLATQASEGQESVV